MMKAITRERFGTPDVLHLEEVDKPELSDDGILVRVRASSVNRAEWYGLTGVPLVARPAMGGFFKPKDRILGTDFAGVVEAVGKDVKDFAPGDEVFGGRAGAYAEYVCATKVERKPSTMSFDEAAALPIAALTALQGLRDKGEVEPGQTVLVNGASGGVGTYAVQIAKALGAEVTAVCSTRNVEQARELGADRVLDYTKEDFTRLRERFDVVFDNAGSKPWRKVRRILKPKGTLVMVGAPKGGRLLGPLKHIVPTWLATRVGSRKVVFFVAKFDLADLTFLRELAEAGKLRSAVERRYPLTETAEALRYMGEGHARGKIVITVP